MPSPKQIAQAKEEWERLGVSQVRSNYDRNLISAEFTQLAAHWLAEKDRGMEARRDASISEQIAEMRRASSATERQAIAAERANTRATIALAIAIISIPIASTAVS